MRNSLLEKLLQKAGSTGAVTGLSAFPRFLPRFPA